jgi:hypothetical protein
MLQADITRKIGRSSQTARLERLLPPQMIQKTKAVRFPKTHTRIFEVQSSATGRGIYNCFEQEFDLIQAGPVNVWDASSPNDKFVDKDAVSIEVFNLWESDPVSSYTPALCKMDRILAQQIKDNEGNLRWMGTPLGPDVKMVKSTENAPSTAITGAGFTTITCDVYLNDGGIATVGELGYNIEVHGFSAPVGTHWDEAIPMIIQDNLYFAKCLQGTWYFEGLFIKSCVGDNVICKT